MPQHQPSNANPSTTHRLELAYAAIRRLPPLDRSLILLALDGLSYREMAAICLFWTLVREGKVKRRKEEILKSYQTSEAESP